VNVTTKMLDSLGHLREVVAAGFDALLDARIEADEIYCPRCSGRRRVKVQELKLWDRTYGGPRRKVVDYSLHPADPAYDSTELPEQRVFKRLKAGMAPALFLYECNQCSTKFTAVVYSGPAGDELAVFPSVLGGLSTKNTPKSVAYYLDQSARSQAAGARSAAIAMYRSALEHVLEEQGYKQRMCGPKIKALQDDLNASKAPKWAQDIDHEVLKILSQLGNGVLHTNDGDITLQENATPELLEQIALAFEELLEYVYERPAAAEARKLSLQQAASKMKK
jgi:DNA-directed RNA polymerase subunit RPC12/RpoP